MHLLLLGMLTVKLTTIKFQNCPHLFQLWHLTVTLGFFFSQEVVRIFLRFGVSRNVTGNDVIFA